MTKREKKALINSLCRADDLLIELEAAGLNDSTAHKIITARGILSGSVELLERIETV